MQYETPLEGEPLAPSSRFWDRVALRYSRKPIEDWDSYQTKLAITREYLDPAMRLLELGCGTGGTALIHAHYVKQILATDLSEKMISIALRKLYETEIDNVEFGVSSVEELTLDPRSFEMVLGLSLLHLVQDRRAAMAKIARLLTPGGLFVTSTPCLDGTIGLMRYVLPVGAALGLMPRVSLFTKDVLRREMAEAGFRIEREFEPPDGRTLFIVARLTGS